MTLPMMLQSPSFRAALLTATIFFPGVSAAQTEQTYTGPQTALSPNAAATENPAVAVLLQRAAYWRGEYQPDQAIDALNRALQLEPQNTDALAMLAELEAQQGKTEDAQAALNRLRAINPTDVRQSQIEQALRVGSIDQSGLDEARELAKANRPSDAVAAYQRVFKGSSPPPSFALEYYQTLSGVPGEWAQARSGLARAVQESPRDLRTQLAYAQVLTYQDETRAEGIQRLRLLAQNSETSDAATTSLRQALSWLPSDSGSIAVLKSWMAAHPNDQEIEQRLLLAENPPPPANDPGGQLRASGFAYLNSGKLDLADQQFEAALAKNADDAQALGGIGLVRVRQGKAAEARNMFQRAIALDPDHKAQWLPMLASGDTGAEWARVNSLSASGNYEQAETLLRRLMVRQRYNVGASLLLGTIQTKAGELADAEATYRRILDAAPDNDSATLALANVLILEKRPAEADELFARALASGSPLAGKARAAQLQARAEEIDDPEGKLGLYRAAIASDPSNPWLRLALARVLVKFGRTDDAAATMRQLNANGRPTGDALQAELIFANESGNSEDTLRLAAMVPSSQRTPEMRRLLAKVAISTEIRRAILLSDRNSDTAREKLLEIATLPDSTGDRGVLVAQALIGMDDKRGAELAIENAMASTPLPTVDARIAYAGELLSAGYSDEANSLIESIDAGTVLTTAQQTSLTSMKNGIAVTESDQLANNGRAAEAFDALAPQLQKTPTDPSLNMALSRLYQNAHQPEQALRINLALLDRDPRDFDVRRAAAEAAVAASDFQRAEQLADDGLREAPADPQAWLLAADIAKAAGDNRKALHDYEVARSLRRQQLGFDDVPNRAQESAEGSSGTRDNDVTGGELKTASSSSKPTDPVGERGEMPLMDDAQASQLPVDEPVSDPADEPTRGSAYVNPFQDTNPAPNQSDDDALGTSIPNILSATAAQPGIVPSARSVDPMTQQIQNDIDALQSTVAPSIEMGTIVRSRSGTAGQGELGDVGAYVSGQFSPGGVGTVTITATPEALSGGTLATTQTSPTYFGELPLSYSPTSTARLPLISSSSATGVGLSGKYALDWLTADVGTSPIGFAESEVVGGVDLNPPITSSLRLDLMAERRAVTDSVLSYAGSRDPVSGQEWGGVYKTHGHAGLSLTDGDTNFYAGGGYAVLHGQTVLRNSEIEAGAGGSTQVANWTDAKLRVGVDLVYFGYQNNLSNFTLGQGGYFSPQSFFAALLPVTYSATPSERLTYSVGGQIGFQTFTENNSDIFPDTPGLQAQVSTVFAKGNASSKATSYYYPFYTGSQQSGIAGGLNGAVEYKLTNNLTLGAKASLNHFGIWNEGIGQIYARYIFTGNH